MAFRIGKSVMLYFGNDLEPIFIFLGLSFLLLIGPLLRWYFEGMIKVDFKLPPYYLIELTPFLLAFLASFFVRKNWFETNSREVIVVFASILIFIYFHFAFHIFLAYRLLQKAKRSHANEPRTKSQKAILSWLNLLIIGFALIWVSYVLNIIEGAVPYITGPIIYSLVIYVLSFKAAVLKVTDIDGNIFKKNDDNELFSQITKLIATNKLYLKSNISLSNISRNIGHNTQKTSSVINQYAQQNFNDFINHYRIEEAKRMLVADENKNFTISSIAFDVGFSSLSTFNAAFKKFEGITPSVYRKQKDQG